MAVEYTGAGGVRKNYDRKTVDRGVVGKESTRGDVKELSVIFDYSLLPSYSAAAVNDACKLLIPANAAILDFWVQIITTFVGGTSLEFGTVQADSGTAIDADGLIPAAVGVTANLVAGNLIAGRGAQVIEAPDAAGTAHVDADGVYVSSATGPIPNEAALLSVVAVGTFTAGRAKVLLRYLELSPVG